MKKSFTLIELLVVIAVIGLLSSIVLVNLQESRKRSQDAALTSELSQTRSRAQMNVTEKGNYQDVCEDPEIKKILEKTGGGCQAEKEAYCIEVEAATEGSFCSDHTGTIGKGECDNTSCIFDEALVQDCEPNVELGDICGGGIVAYNSGSYILIAAPTDTGTVAWINTELWDTAIGEDAQGTALGTGQANSTAIMAQSGHTASAAQLCEDYTHNGYNDWFLPSKDELNEMYKNLYVNEIGGFADTWYWSSSEEDISGDVWSHYFNFDVQSDIAKRNTMYVRCVRAI